MYVIIARKKLIGMSRGYERVNNHIVVSAADETTLAEKLNELVNEGARGDHHEIVQVLWKS